MPALGVSQKPVVMPTYPHMLAEDTAVWTKYLQSPLVPIKELWYDVHVGKGIRLEPGASEMDQRIAAGITRKRIDVVCRVGGGFWVVEVKPRANMVALGQVISYTWFLGLTLIPYLQSSCMGVLWTFLRAISTIMEYCT
ncbi:hypothetical protein ES703_123230 [subsurface metagenome]